MPRRLSRISAVALVAALILLAGGGIAAAPPLAAAPLEQEVVLVEVADGLGVLTHLDAPAYDHRVFISDLAGRIWILERGERRSQPFLDISSLTGSGEHGLLGFAFHPDYESNGRFFVHYVNAQSETQIVEYEVSNDPNVADPGSGSLLFETSQPNTNHNGGSITFGPDEYLYIALGDGGGQHDPGEHGQNIESDLGSILRIDVDGAGTYTIPPDNPFVGGPGLDEIWLYGLRNPWRISWDFGANRLYVADVGQSAREEINIIRPGEGGANLGWDIMEGTLCHEPASGCPREGLRAPDLQYPHSEGRSITGGYVYRGREIPRLTGHYFYADWGSGFIRSFRLKNGAITEQRDWTSEFGVHPGITAFGTDGFGELYFVTGSGSVWRISSASPPVCDFDGDGFDDLAIGVPGEAWGAGAVNVLRGGGSGVKASGDLLIDQNSPGVATGNEAADRFGATLACGDFDGDRFQDLAISAPLEDLSGVADAGVVHVIPGSRTGLRPRGSKTLSQATAGLATGLEPGDRFGATLASGDFNGDGFSDLAIGVPGEDVNGNPDAGAAHVIYGGRNGLSPDGSRFWSQDSSGIRHRTEAGDGFGSALAPGDFDGDGFDDLAIGAPAEDVGGVEDAGLVHVIYGRTSGLGRAGDQVWSQGSPGIATGLEPNDGFGWALSAGDFDGDGRHDLAIGVPDEDIGGKVDAGAVHVLSGSAGGLVADQAGFWTQESPGVANRAENGDGFGTSLAARDWNADQRADLAIGIPTENLSGHGDAGAVAVLYGASGGLTSANADFWSQDRGSVENKVETGDRFGAHVGGQDHNGDGHDDLVVGAPFEDVWGTEDAGLVNVLYGSPRGLTDSGNEVWHQDKGGVLGGAGAGDELGTVAASG